MIAWSYTRLSDFEACPYRFKLKYIDKKSEAPSPAAERGTLIHKQYEDFMLKDEPCPSEFFTSELTNIKKLQPWNVETQWAFDKNWKLCEWFSPDTWVRIKPDLYFPDKNNTLTIIDYKTGKKRPIPHTAQGQLYALGAYAIDPLLHTINIEFWYHDFNTKHAFQLTPNQLEQLKIQWTNRAQQLETDTFNPKPNKWNCKFCGVKEHCEYTEI